MKNNIYAMEDWVPKKTLTCNRLNKKMAYHEVHNAVCHFGVVGSDVSDIIMLSYKYDCCDIIFLSYDM